MTPTPDAGFRRCAIGIANKGSTDLTNPEWYVHGGRIYSSAPYTIPKRQTGLTLFHKKSGKIKYDEIYVDRRKIQISSISLGLWSNWSGLQSNSIYNYQHQLISASAAYMRQSICVRIGSDNCLSPIPRQAII